MTSLESCDPESRISAEVNIVVIGGVKSGKSSVVRCISDATFTDLYTPTIGVDYEVAIINVDGKYVKAHMWDVSGQENFINIAKKHITEADGVVFLYDVTDINSFTVLAQWLLVVNRYNSLENVPKIVLGNKMDLRHHQTVSASSAKEFAIPEGMSHMEVSSRLNKNIRAGFYVLCSEILRHRNLGCIKSIGRPQIIYDAFTNIDGTELEPIQSGPEYSHMFKLLLLGSTRCGKTCLRFRFASDHYAPEYYTTAGFDYSTRTAIVEGHRVKVQIWDISGDAIYDQLRRGYYKAANGFILAYDVGSRKSFHKAEQLLKELDMSGNDDAPKVLMGTKCDLGDKRTVSFQMAKEFADGWRIPVIETSARIGTNVDVGFMKLILALKKQLAPWKRVYDFSLPTPCS